MSQANNQELIWQGNFSLSLAYIMPVDKRGSNYICALLLIDTALRQTPSEEHENTPNTCD